MKCHKKDEKSFVMSCIRLRPQRPGWMRPCGAFCAASVASRNHQPKSVLGVVELGSLPVWIARARGGSNRHAEVAMEQEGGEQKEIAQLVKDVVSKIVVNVVRAKAVATFVAMTAWVMAKVSVLTVLL